MFFEVNNNKSFLSYVFASLLIILILNWVSQDLFVRFDLTDNKMFSLSKSSKSVVKKLTGGVSSLFKKNKVSYLEGTAKIINSNSVLVDKNTYNAKTILISTGSVPSTIKNVDVNEKNIVSSTGALEFSEVPKDLAVIGGGYIGLELGSVWKRLGSNVTVIEFSPNIVPTMDKDTADIFFKTLRGQGLNFLLNTGVESAKKEGDLATPKGIFKLGMLYYRKDRIKLTKCKIKTTVIKKNMGFFLKKCLCINLIF